MPPSWFQAPASRLVSPTPKLEKLVDFCGVLHHAVLDSGLVPTAILSFFLNKSLANARYYQEIVEGKRRRTGPRMAGLALGIPDLGPSVVMPDAQLAPNKCGLQSCACTTPVASQIFLV